MSTCDEPDCDCVCHDNDGYWLELSEDLATILDAVGTHFNPAGQASVDDYAKLISDGLEKLENEIDGKPGDPGKLYPLHERVRRVVGALQGKIGALESRGRR